MGEVTIEILILESDGRTCARGLLELPSSRKCRDEPFDFFFPMTKETRKKSKIKGRGGFLNRFVWDMHLRKNGKTDVSELLSLGLVHTTVEGPRFALREGKIIFFPTFLAA